MILHMVLGVLTGETQIMMEIMIFLLQDPIGVLIGMMEEQKEVPQDLQYLIVVDY